MKNQILQNIKHLPSTIAGGALASSGLLLTVLDPSNPVGAFLQQYAAVNPKVAGLLAVCGGLVAILGIGPKKSN